jgi:hypothetical protein
MTKRLFFTVCIFFGACLSTGIATTLECRYHQADITREYNTEGKGWTTSDSEYRFESGKLQIHISRGSGAVDARVHLDGCAENCTVSLTGTCTVFTKHIL